MIFPTHPFRVPVSIQSIAWVILCVACLAGCDSNGSGSGDGNEEPPNIALSIIGPGEVAARASFQYQVSVTNNGGDAREVSLTATFHEGIRNPSVSDGGSIEGNIAAWPTINQFPAGESRTYSITMEAAKDGEMVNRTDVEWLGKSGAIQNFDTELRTVVGFDTLYVLQSSGGPSGGSFGESLIDLGDLDADGTRDFAILEQFTSSPWIVRIYSGKSGTVLSTISTSAVFMFDMKNGGDVNADGYKDLVLGSPDPSNPFSGVVQVFSGIDAAHIMTIREPEGGHDFGYEVAPAGDVNNDGFDDILVTDTSYFIDNVAHGRVYLYSGLDGSTIWTIERPFEPEAIGTAVASVGDVNGDFVPDVAISNGPAIYLHSGLDGASLSSTITAAGASELIFGLSSPGDLNSDGIPDLYVGDTQQDGKGGAYVLSGVDGSVLLSFFGESSDDFFGDGHPAGDLDGDGTTDFIICAWNSDSGASNGGTVTLFSGGNGSVIHTYIGREPQGGFGLEAIAIDDINEDGYTDFLISTGTGKVLVVAGVPD